MAKYYRIKGRYGVYLLTEKEMDRAIDRENTPHLFRGKFELKKENEYPNGLIEIKK